MLFEEFFKKKKINLATLQQGQPELFLEFKEHYEQMGEKSFDHTKKYWFNRLRHEYPLPVEVKVEKVHIENQIAEQTVAEALTEPTPQAEPAKLGFRPKFKVGATPAAKPAESSPLPQTTENSAKQEPAETPQAEQPAAEPAKMGFKPRFKAGITKPAEEATPAPEAANNTDTSATEQPAAQPAKLRFKPRFKAGVTSKPADESTTPVEPLAESNSITEDVTPLNETTSTETSSDAPASTPPKPGFKPRFKAGVTTSKSAEEKQVDHTPESNEETKVEASTEAPSSEEEKPEAPATPKLGFKPRFKAGVTTTKPAPVAEDKIEEASQPNEAATPASKTEESPASAPTTSPVKQPYKPRFNPNIMKPKPPAEGEN